MIHTVIEAFVLVLVVVYLFLGSVRATLIPMLAIPVSLIGTLAGMLLMGFSINMLTLFAMVLAIGIVVDDAIVVVEAVEKIMHEEGLGPREASRKAMQGIGGAIVGVTAVICAVFVPSPSSPASPGRSTSSSPSPLPCLTLLSAVTALTLTPALCALILKPGVHKPRPIAAFDRFFDKVTGGYVGAVGFVIRRGLRFMADLCRDPGRRVLPVQGDPRRLRAGGGQRHLLRRYRPALRGIPAAGAGDHGAGGGHGPNRAVGEDIIGIPGFSIFYRYANQGFLYVTLKPWDERKEADQHVAQIIRRLNGKFYIGISEARVFAINEPPISGMGNIAGFDYRLLALDGDRAKLDQAAAAMVAGAAQDARLAGVRNVAAPDVQTLFIDVERNKAKALGVPLADVYATIGTLLGSSFVNQFTAFGTNLKVKLQSEQQFRSDPAYLQRFYVRNAKGDIVPIAALASTEYRSAPIALAPLQRLPRRAAQRHAGARPQLRAKRWLRWRNCRRSNLPAGTAFQWSGQSLQEKISGGQAGFIFLLSFVFVFLFLAALYESWTLPVAVFLIVPIGILGALIALFLRHAPNDVFFQVSLITLVGLAGKNGILIVEFAKQRYEEGLSVIEAALEAARLRLRPIVMTSLAFILGVLPLVRASGAGAATQHSVGTGILGGMLAATLIGVFFTPLFYYLAMTYLGGGRREAEPAPEPQEAQP